MGSGGKAAFSKSNCVVVWCCIVLLFKLLLLGTDDKAAATDNGAAVDGDMILVDDVRLCPLPPPKFALPLIILALAKPVFKFVFTVEALLPPRVVATFDVAGTVVETTAAVGIETAADCTAVDVVD